MNEALEGANLLAELEESIPQGVPNDTGFRRRATDAKVEDLDFAELDAMLAKAEDRIEAEAQYKLDVAARKREFVGMSKEEVDFCNSRMHAFEMARIWEPTHAISVWQMFCCTNCGRDRMVFSRLMEHHKSRVNATTHRWLTVATTKMEAMPVKEIREVPTCPRCSEWDLDPRLMSDLKEVLA